MYQPYKIIKPPVTPKRSPRRTNTNRYEPKAIGEYNERPPLFKWYKHNDYTWRYQETYLDKAEIQRDSRKNYWLMLPALKPVRVRTLVEGKMLTGEYFNRRDV